MTETTKGTWFATGSYLMWGLLPLYWKALQGVSPELVLAHRIVWALLFTTSLVWLLGAAAELKNVFTDTRRALTLAGAAVLISFNWWLYIWAIDQGHVVETALGYYINPLVSVLLGIFLLKEKLSRLQTAAFTLAAAGVVVMTLAAGRFPFIALGLALSFGFYGLLKKRATVSAVVSLQVETLFSLPLALGLFFLAAPSGVFGPAPGFWQIALLVVAGPVTALPLWLFGAGARLIPLTRLGFLQYLSPTLTLLLGLFVFHESFDLGRAVAFGCIWTALVLFTVDGLRARRPS